MEWSVASTVNIEATSYDEALFLFEEHKNDNRVLPVQFDYIEDSYKLSSKDMANLRLFIKDIHFALQEIFTINDCEYESELLKLQEKDNFFLSRLCIYRELRDKMKEEKFLEKEVNDLVDILFEFYINAKIEDFTAVSAAQCCLGLLDDFNTLRDILNYQPIEFQPDNVSGLCDKLIESYCNRF